MKFRRNSRSKNASETPLAAMIDIVFLLLVFFMLTLKIIPQEGQLEIDMPTGHTKPTAEVVPETEQCRIELIAREDGELGVVRLNNLALGTGDQAFERLHQEMAKIAGYKAGQKPTNENVNVEIQADYQLKYQYTIQAMGACQGSVDASGRAEPFVKSLTLLPPAA